MSVCFRTDVCDSLGHGIPTGRPGTAGLTRPGIFEIRS